MARQGRNYARQCWQPFRDWLRRGVSPSSPLWSYARILVDSPTPRSARVSLAAMNAASCGGTPPMPRVVARLEKRLVLHRHVVGRDRRLAVGLDELHEVLRVLPARTAAAG